MSLIRVKVVSVCGSVVALRCV